MSVLTRTAHGLPWAIAVLISLGTVGGVSAQDPSRMSGSERQQWCSERVRQFTDASDPVLKWRAAQYPMQFCPEAGPAVIAAGWSTPPADSLALSVLTQASVFLVDERILRTVLERLLDEAEREDVRVSALQVASHYADSTLFPTFGAVYESQGIGKLASFGSPASPHRTGPVLYRALGSQRVVGNAHGRLVAALDHLLATAGDRDTYLIAAVRALRLQHFR